MSNIQELPENTQQTAVTTKEPSLHFIPFSFEGLDRRQFVHFEIHSRLVSSSRTFEVPDVCKAILSNLRGKAAVMAQSVKDNVTKYASVDELFEDLRQLFVTSKMRETFRASFERQVQAEKSILAYECALKAFWRAAYSPDERKSSTLVQRFLSGLSDNRIKDQLVKEGLTSYEEVLQRALFLEALSGANSFDLSKTELKSKRSHSGDSSDGPSSKRALTLCFEEELLQDFKEGLVEAQKTDKNIKLALVTKLMGQQDKDVNWMKNIWSTFQVDTSIEILREIKSMVPYMCLGSDDGIIYLKKEGKSLRQIVVPETHIRQALEFGRKTLPLVHLDPSEVEQSLAEKFWWPGMSEDVEKYCSWRSLCYLTEISDDDTGQHLSLNQNCNQISKSKEIVSNSIDRQATEPGTTCEVLQQGDASVDCQIVDSNLPERRLDKFGFVDQQTNSSLTKDHDRESRNQISHEAAAVSKSPSQGGSSDLRRTSEVGRQRRDPSRSPPKEKEAHSEQQKKLVDESNNRSSEVCCKRLDATLSPRSEKRQHIEKGHHTELCRKDKNGLREVVQRVRNQSAPFQNTKKRNFKKEVLKDQHKESRKSFTTQQRTNPSIRKRSHVEKEIQKEIIVGDKKRRPQKDSTSRQKSRNVSATAHDLKHPIVVSSQVQILSSQRRRQSSKLRRSRDNSPRGKRKSSLAGKRSKTSVNQNYYQRDKKSSSSSKKGNLSCQFTGQTAQNSIENERLSGKKTEKKILVRPATSSKTKRCSKPSSHFDWTCSVFSFYPRSSNCQTNHLLIMTASSLRWPEIFFLAKIDSETVCQTLVKEFFPKYAPGSFKFYTDSALTSITELFHEVCKNFSCVTHCPKLFTASSGSEETLSRDIFEKVSAELKGAWTDEGLAEAVANVLNVYRCSLSSQRIRTVKPDKIAEIPLMSLWGMLV